MAGTFNQFFKSKPFSDCLWDLWCLFSGIGIWPRFIEPNLLSVSKGFLSIPDLPLPLEGLNIVHISDLHLDDKMPYSFTKKLIQKVKALSPDLIVFTGDFLCYAELKDKVRLKSILCSFHALYGCYAILGNHDYAQFVSLNSQGEYDVVKHSSPTIVRGFKRMFSKIQLKGRSTPQAQAIGMNQELLKLLDETPFKLLHNECVTLTVKGENLNLCGLGEYSLGRCLPEKAFQNYQKEIPGIILSHNPDSISLLKNYPGSVILSGHTHGGQINLPWIWKKFTLLENPQLKRGLIRMHQKQIYVNRGLGSVLRFRWFALPEITQHTLKRAQ